MPVVPVADENLKLQKALETYRSLFATYLQKSRYNRRPYQYWLNKWFNTAEQPAVRTSIQDYVNSYWLRRWWLRQITNISLKLKLQCVWAVRNYAGNVEGLMTQLSELKTTLGWFSWLGWRLWFMELGKTSPGATLKSVLGIAKYTVTKMLGIQDTTQIPRPSPPAAKATPPTNILVRYQGALPPHTGKNEKITASTQPSANGSTVATTPAKILIPITDDIKAYCDYLGLTTAFSMEQLRHSFHKLAHQKHPDKSGLSIEEAGKNFIELKLAYSKLLEKFIAQHQPCEANVDTEPDKFSAEDQDFNVEIIMARHLLEARMLDLEAEFKKDRENMQAAWKDDIEKMAENEKKIDNLASEVQQLKAIIAQAIQDGMGAQPLSPRQRLSPRFFDQTPNSVGDAEQTYSSVGLSSEH